MHPPPTVSGGGAGVGGGGRGVGRGGGGAAPAQKVAYHEGFEGEAPKIALWAKNGESEETFIGPSEEQAFEGKRSLKFDVTLKGGSYHYWGFAMRQPCAGRLKLSARVRIGAGNTATVGFGANFVYPPTTHSGCGDIESFDKPMDAWKLVECDLVERGRDGADQVLTSYTATVRGEDIVPVLDRWAIFVRGGAGKRAVLYLDDVRIEGEAPGDADLQADAKARWAKAEERLAKRLAGWRADLDAGEKALAQVDGANREAVEAIQATAKRARELVDRIAQKGGNRGDMDALEGALAALRYGPETLRAVAEGKANGQPYLVYAPKAITNSRLETSVFPIPAPLAKALSLSGCRGEYESVTAAVYALDDVKGLRVSATALKGPAGTIPASAIDIHVVKCWYQAGRGIGDLRNKMLVPELLLKDDALVRVDTEKGENYLRSTAADGTQAYLLCSGPKSENLADVRPVDAETLQPVDVPARALKQFWFTLRIPEDAKPGVYRGSVRFQAGAGSREIPLVVTVHAFDLAPSRLIYSIYYRPRLAPDGKPTITSEARSEEQYRAEMADMKAHGVLYPSNYQGMDETATRRVLEIRKEVGLPAGPFFNLGQATGATTDPAQLKALGDAVSRWVALCKSFGYTDLYFYGIDEATGDQLAAQKAAWKAVQDAGGKTFVACYKKTFEAMGGLLNCAVLAGRPDPEEAKKWHSVGSKAYCYAYPQVGNEEPETYRRNFGLVLWKAGFDGAMDYAYQHGFEHVWNDFDSPHYRDHNFSYPTVSGVVGTIQWGGFREAVDDMRYMTTLEKAIAAAPPARRTMAADARAWLAALDPDAADLYETRTRMVEWIQRLSK